MDRGRGDMSCLDRSRGDDREGVVNSTITTPYLDFNDKEDILCLQIFSGFIFHELSPTL